MNNQTQEALKMAIRIMKAFDNEIPTNSTKEAINACKEVLEQPAQEGEGVVLGGWQLRYCGKDWVSREVYENLIKQPAQEPYGWYDNHDIHSERQSDESIALYTHPHQWQGLTDDEILKASSYIDMLGNIDDDDVIKFARAIEQALRIKNDH